MPINIFWLLIMSAIAHSWRDFPPFNPDLCNCSHHSFWVLTCIWHVVIAPPLLLLCGVEWHHHLPHFCRVYSDISPFPCSVYTLLSFLLTTLLRHANVFTCSGSSQELFASSCWCYTIFLCTKTVSDLDFYHFLPSASFGFFLNTTFGVWNDVWVVNCVVSLVLHDIKLSYLWSLSSF